MGVGVSATRTTSTIFSTKRVASTTFVTTMGVGTGVDWAGWTVMALVQAASPAVPSEAPTAAKNFKNCLLEKGGFSSFSSSVLFN